jgi:thermostable 8-oxoguanine DNA glycosylase
MVKFFGYKSLTPKRYRDASNEMQKVALEMGIMPHQVQALLWVGMRGKAF